uniref:Facilitated trehalose transporter Tret1-like n=1 Tax=Diabrotica virgifera virgifera TaxID=50390 RepID=A0A6P7FG18_DIAVI
MEQTGGNWFLYLSVLSVNLMTYTSNIGSSWTSPFLPKLKGVLGPENNPLPEPITVLEESWITTIISLGSLCGPLFTGQIANRIGKKMTLVLFSIPMLLSNVLLIFANRIFHFYIARFLCGLGFGCVYCIVPPFVAEISNVSNRGKMALLLTFMNTLSHVSVVSIGPYVSVRTFAYLSLIPSLLFFSTFLPFVPESPYFYVSNKDTDKAMKSLQKFRQKEDVKTELNEIIINLEHTQEKGSFKDVLASKVVLRGLLITICLMLGQQLSGIAPINAYQQDIFRSTSSTIPSEISVIIVAIAQLFTVFLAIGLIDRLGRKKLLLISYSGILISLISVGTYFFLQEQNINMDSVFWLPVTSTCLLTVSFRFGSGPVTWSFVAEIFPSNLKNALTPIVTISMVLFGFIVTFTFPLMLMYLGQSFTFWTFAACTMSILLFIYFYVPEIKGKSFLEIQNMLKR